MNQPLVTIVPDTEPVFATKFPPTIGPHESARKKRGVTGWTVDRTRVVRRHRAWYKFPVPPHESPGYNHKRSVRTAPDSHLCGRGQE